MRGLIAGCLLTLALMAASDPGERKPAPDFMLADAKGHNVRLSQLKGKVVLLNFWATWCHGCKEELPWLVEFENRYRKSGFEVLGVSMDEDGWKSVTPFLRDKGLNYPVVIGTEAVASRYGGVDGLPSTFLLDREGRIAADHTGMIDKAGCEKEIQQLLAERAH
jgi:peroxiredoxin